MAACYGDEFTVTWGLLKAADATGGYQKSVTLKNRNVQASLFLYQLS